MSVGLSFLLKFRMNQKELLVPYALQKDLKKKKRLKHNIKENQAVQLHFQMFCF